MAKRLKKTTRQQYQHLIRFIEENRILLMKNSKKPSEIQKVNKLWEIFAKKINNPSIGPIKTGSQWKKIFVEWKVNTRRKSRYILAHRQATNGPGTLKTLNDLEQRLLNIINQSRDTFNEKLTPKEEIITLEMVDDSKENLMLLDVNSVEHNYVNMQTGDSFDTNTTKDLLDVNSMEHNYVDVTSTGNSCSVKTYKDESEPQERLLSKNESPKESYAQTNKTLDQQANATFALADAINNFTEAFKKQAEASLLMAKIKKEEVKLQYYKTFGNLDRFEL